MTKKDYEIKDTDKVFVTMPGGETIERTWGKSASEKLLLEDVDPTIRPLVKRYNDEGIPTLGSCAGHKDRGFIAFDLDADQDAIKLIAREFGLKNVRFSKDAWTLYMKFAPMEPYRKVAIKKAGE